MKIKKPLPDSVSNNEPLARYIFDRKHFSKENKRIKEHAFMPPKGKITVSVIRYTDCTEACILKIGEEIGVARNRTLKAVGSILTKDVLAVNNNLKVEADTERGQHRRHANIVFNGGDYSDAKTKEIAQDLAKKASLLYVT